MFAISDAKRTLVDAILRVGMSDNGRSMFDRYQFLGLYDNRIGKNLSGTVMNMNLLL